MELMIFGTCPTACRNLLQRRFPTCPITYRAHFPTGILLLSPTDVHPAVLVIPHTGEHLAARFPQACVVTCGMSARDSVSCSSLTDGRAVISVVRELPILGGGFVEVQDVCLPHPQPLSAEQLALCTAVCLCAGIAPQRVNFATSASKPL